MNILFVGGYPPPYGGITVHIKRLYQYCKIQKNDCKVIDTISPFKLYKNQDIFTFKNIKKILSIKTNRDVVHFHVSAFGNVYLILVLILFFIKQKKIITIHSGGFNDQFINMSNLKKKNLFKILNSMHGIICVNNNQKELIKKTLNIYDERIKVIPAFIFPQVEGENLDINTKIIINKWRNDTILITSGYLYDYYGYEMILDFLESNSNFKGIFTFYADSNPSYRNKILKRIDKLNNVLVFENLIPESFNWLLKESSIYVRNTDRDGDCVAIREAGYWGKKIVASKSVKRPENVELFAYNEYHEFERAIENVINNDYSGKIIEQENYAKIIFEYYKEIKNGN